MLPQALPFLGCICLHRNAASPACKWHIHISRALGGRRTWSARMPQCTQKAPNLCFLTGVAHVNLKLKYKNRKLMLYPCLLEGRHPWGELEEPLTLGC